MALFTACTRYRHTHNNTTHTHTHTHTTSTLMAVCINSTHTDRATSYFFTKALLELPLLLVQTLMQFFVLYSMIKLQVLLLNTMHFFFCYTKIVYVLLFYFVSLKIPRIINVSLLL
jgi:hypothetical protein